MSERLRMRRQQAPAANQHGTSSIFQRPAITSTPVTTTHPGTHFSHDFSRIPTHREPSAPELTSAVPPIVHELLRSPGQPLDSATRSFMEPRFGHDFSRVRVHADPQAAESVRAVKAVAYTVGRDL